jgi:putative DNA primase/helicase
MTTLDETPKDAARRLTASAIRKGFQPQALHTYTGQDGITLHWRIRLKHPDTGDKWIRPMKLNGEGYTLGEPDYPEGKPLYRLHDLVTRPDDMVVVCEGEWCADALAKTGLLATTSGAADSAGKADWRPLAGRTVMIWADNDEAGRRYAEAVADVLRALGCTVRLIDVSALNLPPKGDVVDWLAASADVTAADIAALPITDHPEPPTSGATGAGDIEASTRTNPTTGGESESLFDAVARLSLLHSLEYEQVREPEAQRLGVRVGVLDKEVSIARRTRQEDGGKAAMFPTVVPWPDPVAGAALLNDLLATIQRFIVCERETAITASLWCTFTWLVDSAQVAPLAVITAPEKRCGKTQMLNLIGRLSRRPLVASNISPAAVFRVMEAHGPTLLLDEADSFLKENEELRGVINSGHTRQSAYVIRTVGDDHEPRQFSTWGAKAISGIGHLAETIMDRAVILELRRKLPSESVQRLRHAEPGLFDRLASKLARYAEDAGPALNAHDPTFQKH